MGTLDATEHRLNEVEGRAASLYAEMYTGDGKENPPMIVRIDRVEQYQHEIRSNTRATKRMTAATMATIIGSILTAFICYKLGLHV